MVEAICYVQRTGIPWRDLPAVYGPWSSVYTRWRRWCQSGLWARLLRVLARRARGTLRLLDASHIKVHQDASNPAGGQAAQAIGRTKGGLNTKLLAWVDARGRAVQVTLAAGQRADVRAASEAPWPKRLRGAIAVADKGFDSDAFRAQLRQRGCGGVHSAAIQSTHAERVASRLLPPAAQGGKLLSTGQTTSSNWDTL